MSFSAEIARKYIFARKRHSVLTILSIAAAVALITVLFTIYSTYISSMLNISRAQDPYHATLIGLTRQEAEAIEASGAFEKTEFVPGADNDEGTINTSFYTTSEFYVIFKKNVGDCDEEIENLLIANGIDYSAEGFSQNDPDEIIPVIFYINHDLLMLENIGDEAKASNIMLFSLFYVLILFIIFCSRLVIDTAFEISSKEREKQFGVLQSIGASKKQIAAIMTYEGGFLSLVGIPLGLLIGIGAAFGIYKVLLASEILEALIGVDNIGLMSFSISPLFILIVAVTGFVWVLLSAYGTGMRAAKMSPVEAIRSRGASVKTVKRRSVFGLLFGWTGRLAARNIRRGKKRFIITILSATLSMVLFVAFLYAADIMVAKTEEAYNEYKYDFEISATNPSYDGDGSPFEHMPRKYSYQELNRLLDESGYFDNIICFARQWADGDRYELPLTDEMKECLNNYAYESDIVTFSICFVDESMYDRIMGGEPVVPYSRLAEENGYVLLNYKAAYDNVSDAEDSFKALDISEGEILKTRFTYFEPLDEPVEIELAPGIFEERFWEEKEAEADLKVLGFSYDRDEIFVSYRQEIFLIGTFEQYYEYFSRYDDSDYVFASVDLRPDADYERAVKFLEGSGLRIWNNVYNNRRSARNMVAMVKMIGFILLALISLIAVINMVNVVSTGILNRRPEIASMKSLGMSRRQLSGMILIECAQYAVVSGIAAVIVSELMLYLTMQSMNLFMLPVEELSGYIDYSKPVIYALIAMAAAFVCAVAAAVFPLRQIERSSITEEIKRID